MLWHLNETKRILIGGEDTEAVNNAERIIGWIKKKNEPLISRRDMLRLGPIRHKESYDKAITLLASHNYLQEECIGRKNMLHINYELVN